MKSSSRCRARLFFCADHPTLIVVGRVIWTDIIQIIGAVIVFSWLFNNANGSVLIII